jgi:hypothetical protein
MEAAEEAVAEARGEFLSYCATEPSPTVQLYQFRAVQGGLEEPEATLEEQQELMAPMAILVYHLS